MLTLDRVVLDVDGFSLAADFSVATGAQVAIIGPSGAGKSTLLSAISGFLEPVSGRVIWNDLDLRGVAPGQRPMTTVFQDNNLFPHLTAFQNIAVGIAPGLRLTHAQVAQVDAALESVDLGGLGARKPAQLSGGQQSRVALARMVVRAQPLMLLDEPFAALGPALRGEMLDLVAQLARDTGATLLMVTHDPRDASRIAGQTILVADHVANAPRDTAALLADPPAVLRDYLG